MLVRIRERNDHHQHGAAHIEAAGASPLVAAGGSPTTARSDGGGKSLALAAAKKGVPARPEIQKQIEQQRRDLLIRTYINEVMATAPAASDSEIRAYYDQHLSDYKMPASVTISHIQLKKENDAKKVLQQARKGDDWMKLAAKYPADTLTRAHGGTLPPPRAKDCLAIWRQPAMAETAFAIGREIGPIKTNLGCVIRVDALRPSTRDFQDGAGLDLPPDELGARGSSIKRAGGGEEEVRVRTGSPRSRLPDEGRPLARPSTGASRRQPAARIDAYKVVGIS